MYNMVIDSVGQLVIRLSLASILLFLIFFTIQTLWKYYKLRHFDGPPGAGLSKWWLIKNQMDGNMNTVLGEVSKKYGSLARIGPQELLTDDPEFLRKMSAVRSKYTRSDWYDVMRLDPNKPNILSFRDEEKHLELRSKMAQGYSGKEVADLEKSVDRQISILCDLIDRKYANVSYPIDFATTAAYFTLDVISDIAYGSAFGFVANDTDMFDYMKTTEQTLPFIVQVGVLPILTKIFRIKAINQVFMPSVKDKLGLGRIIGILNDEVATRYGPEKVIRKDMLGSFVHHGLNQREAESEVLVQIIAGADTTATAIRMTMLHIVASPSIYRKLTSEIASAAQSNRISSPVKNSEAKTLTYLQACIAEGLRIFPPVTNLSMKEVPKEGDTINGQFIPPGTKIATSFRGLTRSKKLWGDDADAYRPERWIEAAADPARLKVMEGNLDLVFGGGRFQCLGKPVAHLELNKVFIELLRRFEFEIADPLKPLLYSFCVGLFIQKDMYLKVTKREVRF